MKTTTKILTLLIALLLCLGLFASCAEKIDAQGNWENATHRSDKAFGEGKKTIELQVIADEQSVTFTIHTDEEMLGDALTQHGLIEGEMGDFGIYIKKVNGIRADYDVDQHYWSLSRDGEVLMTGADMTPIADGEHYEFTRTK